MLIQLILGKRGKKNLDAGFAPRTAAGVAVIALLAGVITGCGSSSPSSTSSNSTVVAQVNVSPQSASLVAGQVITLTPSAVNSSNNAVVTTFTFNSSNTKLATVSPAGQVCGGVWDSTFVVCNGNDAQGNPVTGSATITATAQNVSSGPVSISVHPSVTSVSVESLIPAGTCLSSNQTHQFTPRALHNSTDVTSLVGDFTWASSDATVVSVDTNGLATARTSGLAGVIASIGGTTSPAVPFKTCMPVQIALHLAGDTNGPTESVTLNVTDTKILLADMVDENGTFITPAPITFTSTNSTVSTIAGTTITAQSPGGAGFQAACSPPTCGNGLNTPIYSNVFSVTVSGASPTTTTVYAASSFPPPINTAIPLVPIDISQTPPKALSAVALPGTPNSIVFDRAGDRAYIGTAVGLAILDSVGNTVTVATSIPVGKVLAVSPDGTLAIISNAADDPSTGNPIEPNVANQRVWVFNQTNNTLTTFIAPGAVAATFNDDAFKAFIAANNGNFYVFSPFLTFLTKTGAGSNTDVTNLASGPFVFMLNSGNINVLNTCNNVQQPTANNPPTNSAVQLLGYVKNQDQIAAVDTTGLNLETVHVTQLAVPNTISATNCAPNVSYTNQFFDFGQGAFVARQLLVASDASHIAVLPKGLNKVLTVLPGQSAGVAPLAAGGTEPLTGGMTPDGNTLWIGVAGANSVDRINLLNNIDEFQLPMTFQKSDGSPAPPDLVAIKPK